MKPRLLPALLVLLFVPVAGVQAEPAKNLKPDLLLQCKSVKQAMTDILALAKSLGQDKEARQIDGFLDGESWNALGLDGDKPIGGYGFLDEDPSKIRVYLMVPVAKEKAFLAALENISDEPDKDEDGIYTLTAGQIPFPMYFRFKHGYAYFNPIDKEHLAEELLIKPDRIFDQKKPVLARLDCNLENISDEIRDAFKAGFQQGIDTMEAMEEDENLAKVKKDVAEAFGDLIMMPMMEGKSLGLLMDVGARDGNPIMSAELSLSGRDGTKFAKSLESIGKQSSFMSALMGQTDTALGFQMCLPLEKRFREAMMAALQAGIESDENQSKESKEIGLRVVKALEPTIKQKGILDGGFVVQGPEANKKFTMIGGCLLQDGEKIEKVLRDLLSNPGEDSDIKNVKFDVKKINGVTIHQIESKSQKDEEFGDGPVFLATGKERLMIAMGPKALEKLEAALSARPVPAEMWRISMKPKLCTFIKDQEKEMELVDKIDLSMEAGKALTLKVEAVFKAAKK